MSANHCPYASELEAALRTGRWSEDLRAHSARCEECSETVFVARVMTELAAAETTEEPLPDPGYIWWRARLQARVVAADRATRLITIVQWMTGAWAAGAALFGLFRLWPHLAQWMTGAMSSASQTVSTGVAHPGPVLIASAALLLLLALFDHSSPWAED